MITCFPFARSCPKESLTRGPLPRLLLVAASAWMPALLTAAEPHQYAFASFVVPAATADEPRLERISTARAIDHLEQGSVAWSGQRRCISCHTNGSYMLARPALTAALGAPPRIDARFLPRATAEPDGRAA